MALRMTKPWQPLTPDVVASLPAQLGIYELADPHETVVKIGYAGGNQPFGLRSALASELDAAHTDTEKDGRLFRHECTHGYLTRWQELLMVYQADHGELPTENVGQVGRLGRLSPGVN